MEARVLDVAPNTLVIRTAAFFGHWDTRNFVSRTLAALRAHQPVRAASDAIVSPTHVVDLVNLTLDLLIDRESGPWHLSNRGASSWAALAHHVAALARLPPELIERVPTAGLGYAARRPRYAVLASERGTALPTLENALARYMQDTRAEVTGEDRGVDGPRVEGRRRRLRAA